MKTASPIAPIRDLSPSPVSLKPNDQSAIAAQLRSNADQLDELVGLAFPGTGAIVRPRADELINADDLPGAEKLISRALRNVGLLMPPAESEANKIREQMKIPLEDWIFDEEDDPAAVESALKAVNALSAGQPSNVVGEQVRRQLGISRPDWQKSATKG